MRGIYGQNANNHSDSLFRTSSLSYFWIKGRAFTNSELVTAVNEWVSNSTNATAKYGNINNWNTSNVTNMNSLFKNKNTFNSNISNWNTAKVTNMYQMFQGTHVFNQNISGWNVSKVSNIKFMFYSSRVFNQNIGGWDTAKVTTMRAMFRDARKFNQNISGWNTSKVKIMRAMFYSNSNSGTSRTVFNQNISGWNVGNVTDIHSMFFQSKFNKNISGWNVSKVSIYDNYGKYSNHTNAQFSDSSLLYFTVIKPGYTLSDEIEMINVSSGTKFKRVLVPYQTGYHITMELPLHKQRQRRRLVGLMV